MTTDSTLDTPLIYVLSYQDKNDTFLPDSPLHGLPLYTLEIHESGPTGIEWYTWPADGGWRTPWADETKFHSTLASALQECFLRLLQYSGIAEDEPGPGLNIQPE